MPFATAVPLGRGATGEVLKAWDEEHGRHVALKLLHRTDPESLARLQREARAQRRIDHPNICDVYGVSETPDGRPYIAMRFVDGLPLGEALKGEPLERKLDVMATVAETVQAAHAQSLIHRDLKPGNILVERRDDGRLHPFVLDFGIVRMEDVPGATVTGEVLGTPGYLSPEQASGSRGIDRRSDVFALGVLLYELVAGHNPFLGGSKVESLLRVLEGPPPPLRSAAPQVPADLEAIVDRALETEPRRRYPSAQALADDLRAFLAGRPTQARPTTFVTRVRRRLRRHPRATAAAAVAVAGLVGLLVTAVAGERDARARAALAERLAQRAGEIEARARFLQLLPQHDVGPAMARLEREAEDLRAVVEASGSRARGSGDYALGRALYALDRPGEALDHLRSAFDAGSGADGLAAVTARALAAHYDDRRIEMAGTPGARERLREDLARDVERYLAPPGEAPPEDPWSLAMVAFHTGDLDTALRHIGDAQAAEPWRFEADLLEGLVHRERALDLLRAGRRGEARDALDGLLTSSRRAADKAPSAADAHYALCDAAPLEARFLPLDDPAEALDALTRLEDRARADCGRALAVDPRRHKAPVRLGMLLNFTAHLALRLGEAPDPRLREVEALAAQSLAIEARNAQAYALRAAGRLTLAGHALQLGEPVDDPLFEGAVADMERALELRPGRPFEWEWLGTCYGYWAFSRTDAGMPSSLPLYRKSVAAYRRALELGASSPTTVHASICEVEARAGEEELAHGRDPAATLKRALDACGQALEISPDYSEAHTQIAAAHLTAGRGDLALEALRRRLDAAPGDPEASRHLVRAHLLLAEEAMDVGDSAAVHLAAASSALGAIANPLPREHRRLEARVALLAAADLHASGGGWRAALARARGLVDALPGDSPSPKVELLRVETLRRSAEMTAGADPGGSKRMARRGLERVTEALARRPDDPALRRERARLDAVLAKP
ncbi:MAG: protein kinase [Acidobacteriota bacterium]